MSALLHVQAVRSGYDGRDVVFDVSFHVNPGAFVCLLGPSGCGKSTLLRAIAGFLPVRSGEIRLKGRCVSSPGHRVEPESRRVGMVFQDNALFPHLTVAGNIGFGLRSLGRRARTARVRELLSTVGLEGFGDRYAHELSGGQQQRVALARSLAPEPDLLLLDEPFSSLDGELRERLGYEVRDVLAERGVTTILVTHDQGEAFALAEHVGVLHEGRLLQWDTPYNLYHEPVSRFVADFIGQGVFLRGRLLAPDAVETELGVIRGNRAYPWPVGSSVDVLLRPDDVQPERDSELRGEVVSRAFKGAQTLYTLRLPTGSQVLSSFPSHYDHREGEQVGIRIAADHLVAFPADDAPEEGARA